MTHTQSMSIFIPFKETNCYIFQLPTFRDGDVVVNESSAICLYLEVTVIHEQLYNLISYFQEFIRLMTMCYKFKSSVLIKLSQYNEV